MNLLSWWRCSNPSQVIVEFSREDGSVSVETWTRERAWSTWGEPFN